MAPAGVISHVEASSPFDEAGFVPGCSISAVDGHELFDVLDWRWYADASHIEINYRDLDGDEGSLVLERDEAEEWGIDFTEALFDGTRQCCNACSFCFMRQLPEDARDSLMLRDDDFRLSFLQGTFVTFTNMTDGDVNRIIEQHLSPLRFSLHAISTDLRQEIIGKHAHRGIDVAQRLLDAGIHLHVQIVLMPGVNDGDELRRTLSWAYARRGIETVGIVPVGYTKHQSAFTESFNSADRAQAVIELIRPFQQQALKERGVAWVHASDEFYRNAYAETLLEELPPASYYGDFELFEDGIGIVRTFVDDFLSCLPAQNEVARALQRKNMHVLLVCGYAQREFLTPLIEHSPCKNWVIPLYVKNDYFGGNVDVTGLLCGVDIAPAIKRSAAALDGDCFAAIPSVVFNADGLTLDDMTLQHIQKAAETRVYMVSCQASEFLPECARIACEQGGN